MGLVAGVSATARIDVRTLSPGTSWRFFGASEMIIELAGGDNNGGTLQDVFSANALHMNVRHKVGEAQHNLARPFGAVRLPKYLVP